MVDRVLTQRVELDGDETIEQQFRQIGEAGKKAFADIRKAISDVGSEGPQIAKSFQEISAAVARVRDDLRLLGKDVQNFDRSWKKLDSSFRFTIRRVTILSAALIGAAAGLVKLTLDAARAASSGDPFAREFVTAFDEAAKSVTELRNEMALLFAPGLTLVIEGFTQFLNDNRQAILDLTAAARDALVPVLTDVVALLSGRDQDVQNAWVFELRDTVVALAGAFQLVFSVIQTVFSAIETIITPVVNAFNQLFGTELTARQVIFTVLLGQFLGVFALIGRTLTTVVAGIRLFAGVLGFVIKNIKDVTLVAFTFSRTVLGIVTATFAALSGFAQGVFSVFQNVFNSIVEMFTNLGTTISALFSDLVTLLVEPISAFIVAAQEQFDALVSFVLSAADTIGQTFLNLWNAITEAFQSAVDAITNTLQNLASTAMRVLQPVISFIERIIDLAKKALRAIGALGGNSGGGAVGAFAGGGSVRGPGTATSDSILSWLSDGEFVIRASAVRKYGKSFFEALNSMRFPKGELPAFSLGGLVMPSLPPPMRALAPVRGYAEGGAVNAGRPLTLQLGGETFDGLMAPDEVADRLVRYSRNRAIRTAGRKPSWYGGK